MNRNLLAIIIIAIVFGTTAIFFVSVKLAIVLCIIEMIWFITYLVSTIKTPNASQPGKKETNESKEEENFVLTNKTNSTILNAFENPFADLTKPIPTDLLKPEKTEIKFIFTENKTKDFPSLLAKVKNIQTFTNTASNYSVSLPFSNWEEIKGIFDIVKKWKNAQILVNNGETDKKMLSKILTCLQDKEKNGKKFWCCDKDPYTGEDTNIGCRRLGIYMGNFDDYLIEEENRFRIDKEKLLKEILESAKTCKYCPFFDSHKIWKNYLKVTPAISFNDKRFVCLKMADDTLQVQVKTDLSEPNSWFVPEHFKGKILSK